MTLQECIEAVEKTELSQKMKNSILAILLVRNGDLTFTQKNGKVFLESKLKTLDITVIISESGIITEVKEKIVKKSEDKPISEDKE